MKFLENISITLDINGKQYKTTVPAAETLLTCLRDRLGLFGTKYGCGEGECGACTVLMDGRAVNSCLILAASAQGYKIITIEGLNKTKLGKALQDSFVKHGAVQCGICIPGMLMAAKDFLDHHKQFTEEDIRRGISGNLCRCTGYTNIVKAINSVNTNIKNRNAKQ